MLLYQFGLALCYGDWAAAIGTKTSACCQLAEQTWPDRSF